ncbi:hypothetical protein H5410_031807 [Solanum commersonii]|uniref:Uncharacterized protein n=1 Tax=Solanum commersonii TaxID=4109 RepID=A0A9J5YK98_SOLCO|nr:hypothetical protein H5410_031807 [Solanum commersonii]
MKSNLRKTLIDISWCLDQQFEALEVKLDSQIVVRMINGSHLGEFTTSLKTSRIRLLKQT